VVKKLRFNKFEVVEKVGAGLLVWFLDGEGDMYSWMPRWNDVEGLFLKAINVERFNKPDSKFLNKFAGTAQQVVEGAQRIQSGYKARGQFGQYRNGKLIIDSLEVTPTFDVTVAFLDSWLDSYVEVLVLNGLAILLREFDEDGTAIREYPELEEPEPEDLPF